MSLNIHIINSFRKAFERDCVQLLSEAYEVAIHEKKYKLDWMENDFSELLGYYINESVLSVKKGITCKTERKLINNSSSLSRGFADKLSRIDFVYFKIWAKQRFECYMEAKRLKENDSQLKRAYINEGMDRFISRKYPVGCMVLYLLEGEIDKTIQGVNSLLHKDGRSSEHLYIQSLNSSDYQSNHPEIGELRHLILDFTVDSIHRIN